MMCSKALSEHIEYKYESLSKFNYRIAQLLEKNCECYCDLCYNLKVNIKLDNNQYVNMNFQTSCNQLLYYM